MNENKNPLHQKGKRHVGQKEASLKPSSNKSPQLEMKRFKPRFEKSRRSSEAHSIAIFKEKLKDFGLHHGNGKDELENHNFEVALQGLPVVQDQHLMRPPLGILCHLRCQNDFVWNCFDFDETMLAVLCRRSHPF